MIPMLFIAMVIAFILGLTEAIWVLAPLIIVLAIIQSIGKAASSN